MASAQEAEEFIQSLNGNAADQGNRVERSAKRLLFEILRFTSNKTFHRARTADEPPFILFKIYPDKIVIDCNHDDFTKADLLAICQQGSGKQMKGANFKSIVAATDKAHIQSGNFSFEFENSIFNIHSDVMRPVWVTPKETVPDNLSRVTLYLPDQGSKEETQKLRGIVASQFERLEEPSIIFLQDLLSMRVEYFNEVGKMHSSKDFRKHQVDAHRVSVKVTTVDDGVEKSHTQLYHVTEQAEVDKPMQVMLAFPLWDNIKVGGDTYACGLFNFVQLEPSPLRFHVHSDFNFDDQHGPISASTRTLAIKDLVASAFFQAVLQFCEHPTLRYHWPLFLMSGLEDLDAFWSSLEAETRDWIAQNPVLISRNNKHWRHISHVTILGAAAQDKAVNTLLGDETDDPFISSNYPSQALEMLTNYGLTSLDEDRLFKLLESSLESPGFGRLKLVEPERHEALARLLSKISIDKTQIEKIKSLPLMELQNGDWVSAVSGPLYFPTTDNVSIPDSLGLRMVSSLTSCGQYSKALYLQLGVLETTASYIRGLILAKFSFSNDLSLREIKSYLRYLYLTHRPDLSHHEQPYRPVKVMTIEMQPIKPQNAIVYLPGTDHHYDPESLFGSNVSLGNGRLNFLHRDILNDEPKAAGILHPSWKDWLCDSLGIRQRLSLLRPRAITKPRLSRKTFNISEADSLSEESRYVLEKLPDEFLGFIQYIWAFDGPGILKSPVLLSEVQGLPARKLCTGDRSLRLQDTWVPLKALQQIVKHYMENPVEFPFLNLGNEDSLDMAINTKWEFLVKYIGVKRQNDIDFLLEILNSIKVSCHTLSSWQTEKVLELYTAINTRLQLAIEGEKERALEFFKDSGVLYIDESGPIWTGLSSFRWNVPANLATMHSLGAFLRQRHGEQEKMDSLSELLRVGMNLRDVSVKDVVEELLVLRSKGCDDVTRVTAIYKYMDEGLSASDEIRTAFEEYGLILVEKDGRSMWVTTSQCFWSEADTTPLNSSLRTCYPNLKSFFIDKLGIKVSTYDKLLKSSTDAEDPSIVQGLLLSLMDETEGSLNEFPLEPIRKAKILAVNSPREFYEPNIPSKLCSIDTDFAIADRPYLQFMLKPVIKMLAYDPAEVRRLQPLFRWLSIEDRYLSRCVKESLQDVSRFPTRPWKLADKAYQIARVGATFNIYGSTDDAISLYEQLMKLEIVEVAYLSTGLEVIQDGQTIQLRKACYPSTWISNSRTGLTIYLRPDTHWNAVSALAKRLQEWLMKDTCHNSGINEFEVTNALTSIFNASGSDLDSILWKQGIVHLPFENLELKRKKAMIKVRLPEVDEREPRSVAR